jgi:hypothetical protein
LDYLISLLSAIAATFVILTLLSLFGYSLMGGVQGIGYSFSLNKPSVDSKPFWTIFWQFLSASVAHSTLSSYYISGESLLPVFY